MGIPDLVTSQRLAQGIEVLDAVRGGRAPHPVRVDLEGPWAPRGQAVDSPYTRPAGWREHSPGVVRHNSCLHSLLLHPALAKVMPPEERSVVVRLYDHERRYVPRRLRVPLLDPAIADQRPSEHRIRRPRLFPGAAYDVSERMTGLRGRVMRGDAPMPWARVEARLPGLPEPLGHAHGDDRGEFLLLLGAHPALFNDPQEEFAALLTVYGPAQAPGPGAGDWLAALPLEALPEPGEPDLIVGGRVVPDGHVPAAPQLVSFRLGRIRACPDLTFL